MARERRGDYPAQMGGGGLLEAFNFNSGCASTSCHPALKAML